MSGSVIGSPDPQTERLLEAIFGRGKDRKKDSPREDRQRRAPDEDGQDK